MLVEWPQNFPPEALDITIQALRGQPVDTEQAARCVYHVAGYGAGKFFTGRGPLLGATSGVPAGDLSRDEAADVLASLKPEPGVVGFPTIPWEKLTPILMVLLQELLRRQ